MYPLSRLVKGVVEEKESRVSERDDRDRISTLVVAACLLLS